MNKNKKRHISRGKFERVYSREFIYSFQTLNDDMDYIVAVIKNGFFYWKECKFPNGEEVYYRKSLSEALK